MPVPSECQVLERRTSVNLPSPSQDRVYKRNRRDRVQRYSQQSVNFLPVPPFQSDVEKLCCRLVKPLDRYALQLLVHTAALAIGQKTPPLADIFAGKGGWEGWLQVQLAFNLAAAMNGTTNRAEEVYQRPGLSATLFHENTLISEGDFKKRTIIEIKCQCGAQDAANGDQAFTETFVALINKVMDSPRKDLYKDIPLLAIGFGVTGAPVEAAKKAFKADAVRGNYISWADTEKGFTLFWLAIPGKKGPPI